MDSEVDTTKSITLMKKDLLLLRIKTITTITILRTDTVELELISQASEVVLAEEEMLESKDTEVVAVETDHGLSTSVNIVEEVK